MPTFIREPTFIRYLRVHTYSAYQKNSFFANIGKSGIALWVIKIEK